MALPSGKKLGPYRIIASLGEGGMGEVYRAEDERLGRAVAVKVLPAQMSADPDAIRRFEREARILANLSHPNVVTIFDVGSEKGIYFAVTELLEGETLRSLMNRGLPDSKRMEEIAMSVAEGLAAAHSQGIIHRDLKPENVFITSGGAVKILDFGLARTFETDLAHSQAETQSQVIAGTVPYMSPEQLSGKPVDPRTDIFSFGCLLFEMITRRHPFRRKNAVETISAILQESPAAITESVSPHLSRLAMRCLERAPENRLASAGEIIRILRSEKKEWGRGRGSARAIHSLAILPFENASADAGMEYFSDGITEAIINSLSQMPKLKVMARGTVFHYRGSGVDPLEIGRRLDVGAVLTGRVVQQGDRLLIATELVDVANGWHLWGEQYNRKMEDVFRLQSEIAAEISSKLRLKLTGKQRKLLSKQFTQNTEAYQNYLRGRYFWNRRTEEGFRKAIEYFSEAIRIDPLYALAYTGLADSYALLGDFSLANLTPREAFSRSRAAVTRALEIDEALAEAHTSLAHLKFHEFDWDGAEQEFQRSLELNPGYATAHHWHFMYLTMRGRHKEAAEEMRKSEELDPLSTIIQTDIAACHYFGGRYDEAIRILRKALELDPNFASAHRFLSAVYEQQEQFEEAVREFEKARRLAGKDPETIGAQVSALRKAFAAGGAGGYWRKKLELSEEKAAQMYVSPYNRAQIYASLRENDRAFELLREAYQEGSASIIYLKVDPRFTSLRSDPRFEELLRLVKLQ